MVIYDASTGVLYAEIDVTNFVGDSDLYATFGPVDRTNPPGPGNYQYSSTHGGAAQESIRVSSTDSYYTNNCAAQIPTS